MVCYHSDFASPQLVTGTLRKSENYWEISTVQRVFGFLQGECYGGVANRTFQATLCWGQNSSLCELISFVYKVKGCCSDGKDRNGNDGNQAFKTLETLPFCFTRLRTKAYSLCGEDRLLRQNLFHNGGCKTLNTRTILRQSDFLEVGILSLSQFSLG